MVGKKSRKRKAFRDEFLSEEMLHSIIYPAHENAEFVVSSLTSYFLFFIHE